MTNQPKSAFEKFIEQNSNSRVFEQENLVVTVTELLTEVMESRGSTRADLAKKLGTSKSYITQVMRGNGNLTLRTIADLFWAMDCRVAMRAVPLEAQIPVAHYAANQWDTRQVASSCENSGMADKDKQYRKGDDPKLLVMLGSAA